MSLSLSLFFYLSLSHSLFLLLKLCVSYICEGPYGDLGLAVNCVWCNPRGFYNRDFHPFFPLPPGFIPSRTDPKSFSLLFFLIFFPCPRLSLLPFPFYSRFAPLAMFNCSTGSQIGPPARDHISFGSRRTRAIISRSLASRGGCWEFWTNHFRFSVSRSHPLFSRVGISFLTQFLSPQVYGTWFYFFRLG